MNLKKINIVVIISIHFNFNAKKKLLEVQIKTAKNHDIFQHQVYCVCVCLCAHKNQSLYTPIKMFRLKLQCQCTYIFYMILKVERFWIPIFFPDNLFCFFFFLNQNKIHNSSMVFFFVLFLVNGKIFHREGTYVMQLVWFVYPVCNDKDHLCFLCSLLTQ